MLIAVPRMFFVVLLLSLTTSRGLADDLIDRVKHDYATNEADGTKVHYVSIGEGPLVVFVHGFPDFWYSWSHQMNRLSPSFRCVAMDLRGYNLSDKPEGLDSYDMDLLAGDVVAVIRACGRQSAVVVGHDWGGAIAWQLALSKPQHVDKLISYYRRNYKAELEEKAPLPYRDPTPVVKAKMPVLMFHGLRDKALHHHALNNTWEWVEKDLTIVTLPEAGHWVHQDEPDTVSDTILDWLARRTSG